MKKIKLISNKYSFCPITNEEHYEAYILIGETEDINTDVNHCSMMVSTFKENKFFIRFDEEITVEKDATYEILKERYLKECRKISGEMQVLLNIGMSPKEINMVLPIC